MNILAIDTSTNVLGVGVVSQDKVIGEYMTNVKRNHSTRVLPAIDYLLNDCGVAKMKLRKLWLPMVQVHILDCVSVLQLEKR